MSYRDLARSDASRAFAISIAKASRRLGDKTSVKALHAFAAIAATGENGIGATACAEQIRSSLPGMHKTAARLSSASADGLGLIKANPDPTDPRRIRYRLSGEGKKLWQELLNPFLGEVDTEVGKDHLSTIRLAVTDEADRELFRDYGIDPDRAFLFGSRELKRVNNWIPNSGLRPGDCLRVSPFGGYAITFANDTSELAFFIFLDGSA